MKKNLLFIALLFALPGAWAQVVTTASAVTVCTGATTVDIPVTVSSFTAVGSISLRFSYVNTEITSPSVIYTDPGLTAWGTFLANTGTAGTIIISAYDPDVLPPYPGLTLANGTTLFTLRFTIGTITTPAALTFVENSQGNYCEYGGVGPTYTPFVDTPTSTYYIPGGVTVVPDPTLDQPANATICKGGSTTLTTLAHNGTGTYSYQWNYSSTSGGTYTAVANATPAGITYSGATSASLTITGNGSEAVADKFYKCVLSSLTPAFGGCDAITAAVKVSTVADPTLDQPANSTICKGGNATLTTQVHNGTGTFSYQWNYSSSSGGTYTPVANGTPAGITYSGGTSVSLTITGDGSETVADKFYKCVLASITPTGAGCDATTNAVTLSTVADPTLDQPANASICKGGNATLTTLVHNGTGSFSYQWNYSSASGGTYTPVANGTPTGITYSGGTSTSLTITGDGSEAAADKYYKCVLSTSTPAGAGCDATTTAVTVTSVADPTLDQPANTSVCKGGSATLTTQVHNGTGTFSYQWNYSSASGGTYTPVANGTPTGITYSGGTSTSLTITGDGSETAADKYYKCVLSTSTPAGAGCDATTTAVTVTTVADPTLDQPAGASICKGGSTTLTTQVHNGTGTFSYQWNYSSASGGTYTPVANGTPAGITYSGGTTTSLTITGNGSEATGDMFYKCVLSTNTPTGAGCDATTTAVTVTTVADPTLDQPANTSVCKGGSATLTTLAHNGTGTYSYQWNYSSASGGTYTPVANGTPAGITYSGGTTTSLTITGNGSEATGDMFYKCVLSTNTPTGAGCDATTTAVTVTTVADPTLDQPANTSVCKGGSATLTTLAHNGTGTFSYQWNYSSTSGGTYTPVANGTPAGITYSGGTTTSLTITGNGSEVAGDMFYKCVLSTNTPTGAGCDATTTAVTVTTVADPSISVQPVSPAAICQGLSLSPLTVTASNGTPALTYQWYSNTINSNSGGTSLGSGSGAQTNSYTPPTGTAGTVYYYCVVSASGSGCGDASSNTAKVIVNERKSISGNFSYPKLTGDILLTGGDITVQLYKSSDVGHTTLIDSDVTDGSGYYEFTNLCPACDYDIVATSTHSAENAINTSDAAQVNFYGTNPYLIEKVRFHAGDVGTPGIPGDLTINATDAGRIQYNFVYGNAFDNTWTFWTANDPISTTSTDEYYPSVTLAAGSNLNANMYGLCTGDFNLSFNPNVTKAASSTLDLLYTGNRQVGKDQEFDLPVQMVKASGVGAISLVLNFPSEMVEVKDVIMEGAGGQLDWAVKGNELRIGWNSAVPLNLDAFSELLTLRLKTTSAFTVGNSIKITLANNPLNELADGRYDVIGDAILGINIVDATSVGIDEIGVANKIALDAYPNPFSNYTTISYNLPYDGRATLEISNIMGNKLTTLADELQSSGNHTLKFNTNNLPSGIYFAKLRLKSSNDELIRTIKLINNK